MKYVVITTEACFGIDSELAQNLQGFIDDQRNFGAARAISYRILETDDEYDKWYKQHGISEIEVPAPTTIKFDF